MFCFAFEAEPLSLSRGPKVFPCQGCDDQRRSGPRAGWGPGRSAGPEREARRGAGLRTWGAGRRTAASGPAGAQRADDGPGGVKGGEAAEKAALMSPRPIPLLPPELSGVRAAQEDHPGPGTPPPPQAARAPPRARFWGLSEVSLRRPPGETAECLKKKKKVKTCQRANSKHRFEFSGNIGSDPMGPFRDSF